MANSSEKNWIAHNMIDFLSYRGWHPAERLLTQVARRFYNANVKELNTACELFPSSIIAGMFSFKHEPYFGLDDPAAAEPVKISFSSTGGGAGAGLKLPQQQPEEKR